jgi:hypothetical protein
MITDKLTNAIFSDLLYVGTKKPMGYLPLSSIEFYGGQGAFTDLIHWIHANNYHCRCYDQQFCSILSGALFVWDEIMLGEVLNKYKDILIESEIPIEPESFVNYIIKNTIHSEINLPAYIVIGYAFGDKRFAGKTLEQNIAVYENDPAYVKINK